MPTCNTCAHDHGGRKDAICPLSDIINKAAFRAGCSEWATMPQEARPAAGVSAQGKAVLPTKDGKGGGKAGGKRVKGPNKTEAAYQKRLLSVTSDVRYEALTFKLASGHRYTPDFVVMLNGTPAECHEVKNGAYKHASHGRARLAFDSARVEFPGIRWLWAVKTKDGWVIAGDRAK